jgi:hypothetical protein
MAWLRKTKGVPGSAPGGLEWSTTEDVVEVDDVLAQALLEIPDGGFVSVPAPEPEPAQEPNKESGGASKDAGAAAASKKASASKAAAKTPVSE